jgi:hypothetical protein
MGLQDTFHSVVVAGAATGEAKWTALRAFFNGGGSTRWQLANPAAASTVGMVLTQINPSPDPWTIAIRRVTGGATWYGGADPDGVLALNPGSTTTAMTAAGATEAELEILHTPNTTYTKMVVSEHDDAITILEYGDASENTFTKAMHLGCIYVCADPTWAANRSRGCGVLTEAPTLAGAGVNGTQWLAGLTAASRVRLLNESWRPFSTAGADGASVVCDVTLPSGNAAVACPISMGITNAAASRTMQHAAVLKWLRFVSADATGGGTPGTRFQIGDDAWCRIGATNTSAARLCVSCQKDKAVR